MNISCWLRFFLILAGLQISAQDGVSFMAETSKKTLGVNERLRVDFKMNKDGDNFVPPDFDGFRVIGGPNQSVSTSWINGKSTYTKTYSYFLQPIKEGEYTIAQASVEIKGETFKTTPIEVKVTKAVKGDNSYAMREGVLKDGVKVVAEVSKSRAYLNEAISIAYRIYFSDDVQIANVDSINPPGFESFWHQNIHIKNYNVENKTLNGKMYRSFVCYKEVLYPQKSGKIKIDPLVVNLTINLPNGHRDFFGVPRYDRVNRTFSSNVILIEAKSLPLNKPDSFTGAVGRFNFSAKSSKSSLKATESLQVILKLSGRGNLKLIKLPKLDMPSSIEVYDPESHENINTNFGGMSGNISDSYTLVPQFKGVYTVPKMPFTYFDPKKEKYITIYSDEIPINVKEGPMLSLTSENAHTSSGIKHQKVRVPDRQFHFLKLNANLKPLDSRVFFGSKLFFLLLLLPLLSLPVTLFILRKKISDKKSESLRKANTLARKYLADAKKKSRNPEEFYIALEKAFHNYLKAKLNIVTMDMSKNKIQSLLLEKRLDSTLVDRLIELIHTCEMARYATQIDLINDEVYNSAVEVISLLDKQL